MKKIKYSIIFLLIFMIIGYATISVSLKLGGNANILGDLDDFKVYISNVVVDGKQDLRFVKNDKELFFSMDFLDIGSQHVIKYDVTNASSVFDASLSINCTQGDEYLSVSNEFDVSTNLTSKSTRTGTLTLKKLKSNSNENHFTINVTCTIVASPIEKDSVDDNNVVSPVQPIELQTGDIIDIDGEYFNVISHTEEIVTILSQYNLGTNYRQSNQANYLSFSNTNGWAYTPGPKEIDIQQYDGNAKTYVNEYVSYLKKATRSNNVSGNLITMKELKSLGCTINDDYSYTSNITCTNSEYKPWLFNGQVLWTSSARTDDGSVWVLENDGMFSGAGHSIVLGSIRPVITIPIDVAKKHYVKTYKIGEEVSIGNEKFNIISDNVNKVTMLAQLGLGTDYRQTTNNNTLKFSTSNGWEYKPGPKEIDIQQYDGNAKTYVNEYVSYLKDETGDSTLTGNLITLTELKSLGCTINDDYSTSDTLTCENSQYKTWIINNQNWWTRSANTSNSSYIWMIKEDGKLTYGTYHNFLIIRPVITINKKYIS